MKKKTIIVSIILVAAVLAVLGFANAAKGYNGWHGKGPFAKFMKANMGRMITLRAELDISDEQEAQLKEILHGYRDEIEPVARKILEKKRALREAVLSEDSSKADIRKASNELGEAMTDAAVLASEIIGEFREELAGEQIKMIEEFLRDREESADELLDEIFD